MDNIAHNELPVLSYAGIYASDKNTSMHLHEALEIILVISGRCTTYINNTPFEGFPGQLYVIPPGVPHIQYNSVYAETVYVVFECSPFLFDHSVRCIDTGQNKWVLEWMKTLCELSQQMSLKLCDGILYSLLKHINQIETDNIGNQLKHQALNEALLYIKNNFSKEITVAKLASKVNLSPSHLKALFYKGVGMSPLNYLLKLRMAYARQLLLNQYNSINEVGFQCGFPNANYFSRMFKNYHECTPSQYRKNASAWLRDHYKTGLTNQTQPNK